MEKLMETLLTLVDELDAKSASKIRSQLESLESVYPFNEYEFLLTNLLGLGKLDLENYFELRGEYLTRNQYLYVFEISAPRGFGETWAQGHLKEIAPKLQKPTKKLDPEYSGEYDFYLNNIIKIEVKASRAVDFDSPEPLYVKALSSDSKEKFDMNFQQVKPACCEVFVWIGVWRDKIRYWILSSDEVATNKYYSTGQHRGNEGEGQIHLKESNIDEFSKYESSVENIVRDIESAYKRQNKK
jgi:hypothetical protein